MYTYTNYLSRLIDVGAVTENNIIKKGIFYFALENDGTIWFGTRKHMYTFDKAQYCILGTLVECMYYMQVRRKNKQANKKRLKGKVVKVKY